MNFSNRFTFIIAIMAVAFLAGCRADGPDMASKVTIQFPNEAQFINSLKASHKVSALAAIDYNLLCFAVNIKSPAISLSKNSCDVERGISQGSVPPGSEIIMVDIPMGPNNTFEIYGLLKAAASDPCPKIDPDKWNHPLQKIYLIGKTENVTLAKQDEDVTIYLTMPDQTAHIAAKNSLPASCLTSAIVGTGRTALNTGVLSGANYKIRSKVSFKEESSELLGSTLKIKHMKAGF